MVNPGMDGYTILQINKKYSEKHKDDTLLKTH